MEEKIALLQHKLPETLVENKNVYKILSFGIHELSEDDCLAHFESVRAAIELILEVKLESLNRQRKIVETKKAIAKIAGEVR
jgi:hypothetical protein